MTRIDKPTDHLIGAAKLASKLAHVHVSDYKVGAALLMDSGKLHIGYNIETDVHTLTVHAEVLSVINFLQRDDLFDKPKALCVYVRGEKAWFPCGICRQYIWEKCGDITIIACCDSNVETKYAKLSKIFPDGFRKGKQNERKTK